MIKQPTSRIFHHYMTVETIQPNKETPQYDADNE
jgi:hypothetical protein